MDDRVSKVGIRGINRGVTRPQKIEVELEKAVQRAQNEM